MNVEFNGGYFGTGDDEIACLFFGSGSNITVLGGNSIDIKGGTMMMDAANVLSGAPNMNLAGGTFSTGEDGFTQTAGTLTLNADSAIALGDVNTHQLNFSASNGGWDLSKTLTIRDWKGIAGVTGTKGQIFFGAGTGTLDANQLARIQFEGYGLGAVTLLSTGELVPTGAYNSALDIGHLCASPVPEASTWLGGGGLVILGLWHYVRRRRRIVDRRLKI